MKRIALALGFLAAFFATSGCKKQQNDNDAIRSGIMQHLTGVGTLNMTAMVMDIRNVSINGNQAHAKLNSDRRAARLRGRVCRWPITWKSATARGSFSRPRRLA